MRVRKFRCLHCNKEFELFSDSRTPCPFCGSRYYRWLNYKEFAL